MKTGIVFEGGALRTVFSCGVMDAFMQHNILPDYMIGVSAGAAYGVCYASNQPGRNLKIIMNYRDDKRYMSVGNIIDRKNKCYCGLEFLYETVPNKLVPFDYDTFKSYHGEFYCVVTNVLTGKPEYIRYTGDDPTNQVLKATCALPMLFPYIYINDTPYLDGGLSDSIPFERAFKDGCDRVIVVLTRQAGYKKTTSASTKIMAKAYLKYPELANDLLKRASRYNRCLKKLERYENAGKVIVIRPEHTDGFSRMEKDKEKILALYQDGYSKGVRYADRVKKFYGM